MKQRGRFLPALRIIVLVVVCLGLVAWVGRWTRELELSRVTKKAANALKVYSGDLQSELDKFEALPQILASNPLFVDLLLDPRDSRKQHAVNIELERINRLAETAAIYILDPKGTVLVSSNWRGAVSFVGEDLSFRPYFQQAVRGEPGRYFALGTTSHVRGYYFSAPVPQDKKVLGVLAVKVQLIRLEDIWARGSERVIVTDPLGVIFITSYTPWRFRALYPLSDEVKERLRESRRYGDIEPDALTGTSISLSHETGTILMLKSDAMPDGSRERKAGHPFLIQSRTMPDAGWTVHILSDLSRVDNYVRNVMLLTAVTFLALVLICVLIYNRRKARRERLQLEERSQHLLRKANEQLDDKVRRRTQELIRINQRLQEEIRARKQSEQNRPRAGSKPMAGVLADHEQKVFLVSHNENENGADS